MNPEGGYTRSYRRLWDNPVFRSKQEAAVFAWMKDIAQWRGGRIRTSFGPVELGAGELIFSERSLAEDFGLARKTLRALLQRMVDDGMITLIRDRCPMRAGTIAHLTNYARYQGLAALSGEMGDRTGTEGSSEEGTKRDQKGTANGTAKPQQYQPLDDHFESDRDHNGTAKGPQRDRKGTKNKEGKEGKEGKEDSHPSDGAPAAPGAQDVSAVPEAGNEAPPSARDMLWRQGLSILAHLTGKPAGRCRSFLGRLLSLAGDDCAMVMMKLYEAQSMHPLAEAEAWLMRACDTKGKRPAARKSRMAWMREDPGLAPIFGRTAPAATPAKPAAPEPNVIDASEWEEAR